MNITEILVPGNHDTGRNGKPVTGIVLHTMVGTIDSAQARFMNTTQEVSANYGVGLDGSIRRWVRESDTAWCNGNYQSNLTTISIEHEDNGDYNGPRTPQLYQASSELVADICSRYGIPCDRSHIKGHCEVIDRTRYPGGTACPDSLDLDRIIAGANAILHPASTPAPASSIAVGATVKPLRAVSYEGIELAPFVMQRTYQVTEVIGDRAVLGNGLNTAFRVSDLQVVASAAPAPAPDPAPVDAKAPYSIEHIPTRKMVADVTRTEWDLSQTTWADMGTHVVGTLAANEPIDIVAIAHHDLGSKYYMPHADRAEGYNVVDLHDYTEPTPAPTVETPAPAPATEYPEIIWERLETPISYTAKLQPTTVWGFNHNSYPEIEADIVRQMNQGDTFVAAGRAKHSLGSVYLMTAEDFGDADTTGEPHAYAGVNVVDLNGIPEPAPAAPVVSEPVIDETSVPVTVTPPTPSETVVETPTPSTVVTPTPPQPDPIKGTAADWRKSFKESIKPLVSTQTVWIRDLEGILPDIKLEAGKLIPSAGHFWKDGEKFIQTIPSRAKDHWYAIPEEYTGPVAKSQLKRAEQIVENIFDKYNKSIEAAMDELFHEGMQFEEDIQKGFEELQRENKLAGFDKIVDRLARFMFGHTTQNKK